MNEIWKDIAGFAGYQVGNQGRVRTHNKTTYTQRHGIRRWRDRILSQKIRKDGRALVDLWRDGKPHTKYVHCLVAEAFVPNVIGDNATVNHIDGNKRNNCADNLEWLTLADNILHGFENELYATQIACALINKSNQIQRFRSRSEASRFLGRSDGYVAGAIAHNRKITDINGNEYQLLGDNNES